MSKKIIDELLGEIKITLADDICSAQALDEPLDRNRVLKQIKKTLLIVGDRHANLYNAFNSEIDY